MFSWIKKLINKIKSEIAYRKKLKELKKKDPFIYKWAIRRNKWAIENTPSSWVIGSINKKKQE